MSSLFKISFFKFQIANALIASRILRLFGDNLSDMEDDLRCKAK
jgi:hypothetical protein